MSTAEAARTRRTLANTPVAPSLFAHVVLRTSQAAAMKAWYATVLNARVVHDNGMLCFLTYDEEHHRIALINIPGLEPPGPKTAGLAHIAYGYATLGALLSTYRRLKEQGIEPFWPIHHGMTIALYYRDPDGNQVELQVDAVPDKAAAVAVFDSPAFAANPIGVTFDPETLVRAWETGVPEEELFRQPPLPAGRTPMDMLPA